VSRPLGSIQPLKGGGYNVQVTYYDAAGNQKRKSHRDAKFSPRDAEICKLTMIQRLEGTAVETVAVNDRTTLGTYIEQTWLPLMFSKAKGKRSPALAMEHQSRLTLHVLPYPVAKVPLCDLKARHLDQWMTQLRATRPDLSEQTLHHVYSKLRQACRQAVRWELMLRDPTASMGDIPSPRDYDAHELTADEANMLVSAFWDHPYGLAFALVLGVGLGPGEICGLRWTDFDLQAGKVTAMWDAVPLSKELGGGVVIRQTKTAARVRTKRLPRWALDMVASYRRTQMETNVALGAPEARLFNDTAGKPMPPTFLSKQFTRLRVNLGLPYMRLYDLRHGHAGLLKANGVDIHDVSKRLGHSRIGTTSRYYLGATDAADQHCADVMDSIILPRREARG
jgi:integrase